MTRSADQPLLAEIVQAGAGTILERMALVRRTLDAARSAVQDRKQIVTALEAAAADAEDKNKWALVRDAFLRLREGSSRYPEADFDSARSVLQHAVAQTIRLHQYLGVLPSAPVPRALLSVVRQSYPELYAEIQPTILLLPDLAYYEFDLGKWLTDDPIFPGFVCPPGIQGDVIRLSEPDALSPASWAILAHEFGHAVEQKRDLLSAVEERLRSTRPIPAGRIGDMLRHHVREFLADGIAALAVGPATVLALIRFETMLSPLTGMLPIVSFSHPPAIARIRMVEELLGKETMQHFTATFGAYSRLRAHTLEGVTDPDEQRMCALDEHLEQEFFPPLREAAAAEVRALGSSCFGRDEMVRAERLADRIERGIPPSAIRWTSKRSLRPVFRHAIQTGDRDLFRDQLRFLGERPASPGEILVAQYLCRERRYCRVVEETLASWREEASWDENTSPLAAYLAKDRLLAAAMDTADIHVSIVKAARAAGQLEPIAQLAENENDGAVKDQEPPALFGDSDIVAELVSAEDDRLYLTPLIDPVTQLGPASLDVRLGTNALVIANVNIDSLDPMRSEDECRAQLRQYTRVFTISLDEPLILHPDELALAATLEYLRMPANLAGRLEGRSSYGRAGLMVHATAGFIDPGYEGTVTLELMNNGKAPIKLYPGARVGQLCFFPSTAIVLYPQKREQKYLGSLQTLASHLFEDVEYQWFRRRGETQESFG